MSIRTATTGRTRPALRLPARPTSGLSGGLTLFLTSDARSGSLDRHRSTPHVTQAKPLRLRAAIEGRAIGTDQAPLKRSFSNHLSGPREIRAWSSFGAYSHPMHRLCRHPIGISRRSRATRPSEGRRDFAEQRQPLFEHGARQQVGPGPVEPFKKPPVRE